MKTTKTNITADGEIFSQAQFARLLGVSRQRVNAKIKAGQLQTINLFGRVYIVSKEFSAEKQAVTKKKKK